ncbi:hypothetical protein XMM379_001870 [Aliiroseovarius sp. xm-m-379]|uniref:DUF1153 domain-containing protein n=1 Tax=Aliiroseovarius crassostreae TaxID=154981 RepID=A0A9Q9HGW4_9RHOB|nr:MULTISPECIES: DUF1153 domain-containing protein [Aliiroseovarius]NRP11955.1 hypothetical protein [Aliiroseovarius sp. xm-d-517]NRP25178.1 hypothetical protein [Aliiroseovarius sp. xm-m-379]NRP31090.1 hypothetical protein [Aliiroseovarius sp. xm-m-314]NRP33977.1 hypothetical protein [Aliiroseovarius sp. xm-a-104]NRP41551.1 hypothetical protein [Aliiroseovarius sp. xm-m-339-2]
MYLKKVEGPRSVTLPDGTIMSRADLPSAKTRRWVASRKSAVVKGIAYGLIGEDEAMKLYGLSKEELQEWQTALKSHGEAALRVTALQKYRQP